MTPTDLIKKAMRAHNELGASENITYNYTDGSTEAITCFVAGREYTDVKRGVRKNELIFSQVFLSKNPSDDDKIEYDGEWYRVLRWEKQLGQYIIYTDIMARHTGRRTRHVLSGRGGA